MILSTKTGESLFRSLLTKIPAVEKTRSEGTDVAGIASIFWQLKRVVDISGHSLSTILKGSHSLVSPSGNL